MDIGQARISSGYAKLPFPRFKKVMEKSFTGDFEAAYIKIGGTLPKKQEKVKEEGK